MEILKFIHLQDQELLQSLVQVIAAGSNSVDYLVIAGGGGGGGSEDGGGGGGAGGYRESPWSSILVVIQLPPLATSLWFSFTSCRWSTVYPITVGWWWCWTPCSKVHLLHSRCKMVSASTFSTITSTAGGGGGGQIEAQQTRLLFTWSIW